MRLKEQRLWDTMRSHCPSDIKLMRVENLVMVGMPDIHFVAKWKKPETMERFPTSALGFCGWIELKAVTRPKKAATRLLGDEGLNIDQINWHLGYHQFGGRSWVVIRDDHRELFMVPGRLAAEINEYPLDAVRQASVASGWIDVFSVLRGEKHEQ